MATDSIPSSLCIPRSSTSPTTASHSTTAMRLLCRLQQRSTPLRVVTSLDPAAAHMLAHLTQY